MDEVPEIEVFDRRRRQVARAGRQLVAELPARVVAEGGSAIMAVSGRPDARGSMFARPRRAGRWTGTGVVIFQVDERVAPDGDPDRNLTHLRARCGPRPARDRRPMPVEDPDPDAAGASLRARCRPSTSTWSTSGSAPTATPPRSSRATGPRGRRPGGGPHPASTRAAGE